MAKSFIDVVQDSPRTGLGIPVRSKKPPLSNQLHRPRKRLSAINFTDSWFHPRRRTAGAGPDAISTAPRSFHALHAHRAPSSSSPR